MAGRKSKLPAVVPDNWVALQKVTLLDGREGQVWQHRDTLAMSVHPIGLHPDDAVDVVEDDDRTVADVSIEESPVDRITAILSEHKDGEGRSILNIYRIREDNKAVLLKEMTPKEFEDAGRFEYIRKNWGGGTFEIRLYATDPATGRFNVRAKPRIEIEESRIPEDLPNPSSRQTDVIAKLLERIEKIETRPVEKPDFQDQMKSFFGLMSQFMQVKEVFSSPAPVNVNPANQVRELIELIDGAKTLSSMVRERESAEDPLLSIGAKLMDTVSAAMAAKQGAPEVPALPPIQIPPSMTAPNSSTPATSTPMTPESFATAWLSMQAIASAPVEGVAETIYEHAPDEVLDMIAGDNWEKFAVTLPRYAERVEWYAALRAAVLKIAEEEKERLDSETKAA